MARDYVRRAAKSKSRPVRRQNPQKSSVENRLWLLVCVLTSLFIVGLIALKKEGNKLARNQVVEKTQKNPAKTAQTPQPRFDFYTMLPNQQTREPAKTTERAQSDQVADNQPQSDNDMSDQAAAAPPPVPPPAPPDLSSSESSASPTSPTAAPPAPVDSAAARDQVAALEKQQLDAETPATTDSSAKASYVLQLGLFKEYITADQLKAQLAMQGVEAKVKTIQKDGVTYYRVWMGPYPSKTDAVNAQQSLKGEQVASSLIRNA